MKRYGNPRDGPNSVILSAAKDLARGKGDSSLRSE